MERRQVHKSFVLGRANLVGAESDKESTYTITFANNPQACIRIRHNGDNEFIVSGDNVRLIHEPNNGHIGSAPPTKKRKRVSTKTQPPESESEQSADLKRPRISRSASQKRINHLPIEVLQLVFGLLPVKDIILGVGVTCKRWRCMIEDEVFWRNIFKGRFGTGAGFIDYSWRRRTIMMEKKTLAFVRDFFSTERLIWGAQQGLDRFFDQQLKRHLPVDVSSFFPLDYIIKMAIWNNNTAVLQSLTASKLPLTHKDIYSRTALHIAARQGSRSVTAFLLDAGLNINQVDNLGQTPLMAAAEGGHEALVEYIVSKGADPLIRYCKSFKFYTHRHMDHF
eukprot:TRINITY_DN5048_c0_g1_i4.p1 TRINITY_DN5048_c0_g1~~TRINITY_DN5048_c0_g1_i4.p1  ORF type:complete len:337 (+),score=33.35 TRINITY_DN5048_c0_g1_i4:22-1032(+)